MSWLARACKCVRLSSHVCILSSLLPSCFFAHHHPELIPCRAFGRTSVIRCSVPQSSFFHHSEAGVACYVVQQGQDTGSDYGVGVCGAWASSDAACRREHNYYTSCRCTYVHKQTRATIIKSFSMHAIHCEFAILGTTKVFHVHSICECTRCGVKPPPWTHAGWTQSSTYPLRYHRSNYAHTHTHTHTTPCYNPMPSQSSMDIDSDQHVMLTLAVS